MAGLQPGAPRPTEIKLHQKSRVLEIAFDDGKSFRLECELLRVYSPSAEVRGHGPGQEVLQIGKKDVEITAVEPVGNYAVRLVFSDGHDTGLYSWDYLYGLGADKERLWNEYLDRTEKESARPEVACAPTTWREGVVHVAISPPARGACTRRSRARAQSFPFCPTKRSRSSRKRTLNVVSVP